MVITSERKRSVLMVPLLGVSVASIGMVAIPLLLIATALELATLDLRAAGGAVFAILLGIVVVGMEVRYSSRQGETIVVRSLVGTKRFLASTTRLCFRVRGGRGATVIIFATDGVQEASVAFAVPLGLPRARKLLSRCASPLGVEPIDPAELHAPGGP